MIRRLTTFTLAVLATLTVAAQSIITGTVSDSRTGEALIGAAVKVINEKGHGVVTDVDGRFTLNTKQEAPLTLSVEYVGYRPLDIEVYDFDEPVNISLIDNSSRLEEVVVVGYGTQKRTQLTGSVTTIASDIFEKAVTPTLDGALQGQVAGLNVTAASGQPGADAQIRIRGGNSVNASNEPLYVIDGFIYFRDTESSSTGLGGFSSGISPLATVNPQDIESIEVLKDVSATAIYGSRGANGVIIVTTKRGQVGQKKPVINYTYSIGASHIGRKLDLLNATEWAAFQKKYFGNKGGYTDEQIAQLGKGTDWQSEVLRTAIQQQHDLSISGATEKSRYAFSASYTDQDGIILNSGFQRYNFHTNNEWELQKGLHFGVNATYGRSRQQGLTNTEGLQSKSSTSPFSAGITNSFVYALLTPPVVNVYNADGSYNFNNPYEYAYFAIGDHASNAVYDLKESVAQNTNNYLLSNVWATYRIGHFLLKASVGLSSEKLTQEFFSGAYTSLGMATEGIGGIGNRQTDVWQQEYTANYNREFQEGKHTVDALVGFTRQTQTSTYNNIQTNHFTNEALKQYNLGDGANIYTPQTGISESSLNSLIARVNYSLLDRYNVTATLRADESSRFSSGNRWGWFPSIGISWNANKEAFLQRFPKLDYLKVRLSAGTVGNQEISDYAFSTSYSTGSYAGSSSYAKQNTANNNLKWETTASYNLGFDLGLWHDRLNVVFDLYYKKTSDLLLIVPVGFASGVSTQLQNVGNVVNRGVELAATWNPIHKRSRSLSITGNIALNHNEITEMGNAKDILQGSDSQQILRKGESLGSFYGLQFLGIVQQGEDVSALPTVNGLTPKAGDVKYLDTDGNGRIDGNDRQILDSIQPKAIYGLQLQYTYRRFDFSAAFSGSYGAKLYNALGRRLEQTGDSYNVLTTVLSSWTPEAGGNVLPLATTTRPFSYIDSRYIENASYFKLKNLTVAYRLPLPRHFPAKVRLSLTATNLFTITPYKGYDPEVAGGTDYGAYPSSRTFTFGVNVTL